MKLSIFFFKFEKFFVYYISQTKKNLSSHFTYKQMTFNNLHLKNFHFISSKDLRSSNLSSYTKLNIFVRIFLLIPIKKIKKGRRGGRDNIKWFGE